MTAAPSMASMMSTRLLFVAALGLIACGPPPPVDFANRGETVRAEDYRAVHARWTRRLHLNHGVDTALEAHATLMSDEMRAALVARVASMRKLPTPEREALARRNADDAARWTEFVVEAVAHNWDWSDLGSNRSVWTATLDDASGRRLAAPEVIAVTDRPAVLEELFPPIGPFTRSWRLRFAPRFPDGTPVLGPQTTALTLRFAGPLGTVEATWRARR